MEALEALVDCYGLPSILDWLSQIAADKAVHIATNWQDTRTAKVWERDAGLLAKLAEAVD
jgi:hypothetical protein